MPDINKTLAERGERYGKFADRAVIAQGLKRTMWAAPGWARLADDQKQALEVIADKQARILNGDPDYIDNWHDIIGYAKLVEDRLASTILKQFAPEAQDEAWNPWTGSGYRPTGHVEVRLRMGDIGRASDTRLRWTHTGEPGDIVAWRPAPTEDVKQSAPTAQDEGWIDWTGVGDPPTGEVEVRLRCGRTMQAKASDLDWSDSDDDTDIVAWRHVVPEDVKRAVNKANTPGAR